MPEKYENTLEHYIHDKIDKIFVIPQRKLFFCKKTLKVIKKL